MSHQLHVLVGVAWPYANADIHQGNVTGSYLPADIFTRYHRLHGDNVLMVSGSDSHGTPVAIKAEEQGKPVREVFEYYHLRFLEVYKKLGIAYDLFTHTDTLNHFQVAQDIFTKLLEHGYLSKKTTPQMYSSTAHKFLPDRYVEGTCPSCGYERARGDQCDNCNRLFESAGELLNFRSKLDDSPLELRETEHFFIDLPALARDGLALWISENKEHWRPPVLNFTRNLVLEQGLIQRAITRDMDWGVPVPVQGYENKVLYVWFEAVIGYLSATREWARLQGRPEAWKEWWYDPGARHVYFLGKDNIPFHTIMWPAILLGAQSLYDKDEAKRFTLPYDVPANQFMNMEGRKISGSLHWGVWMLDALERYDPDSLRYYLTVMMPETRDSDWSWEGFVARNNSDLVGNWGNLVNRVLQMTHRFFQGVVPDPGGLDDASNALITSVDQGFEVVGNLFSQCKFRAAVQEAMTLSTQVNKYLEEASPWLNSTSDPMSAARCLYTSIQAISGLGILFAPVLPFSSQRVHELLGEEGTVFGTQDVVRWNEGERSHSALVYNSTEAIAQWKRAEIPPGRKLPSPTPIFKKLDPSVVAEELNRLGT